jgi:hypothetical protein
MTLSAYRAAATVLLMLLAIPQLAAQPPRNVKAFNDRVNWYVQVHREMEGPVPALETARDMDEVHQRMRTVRVRILAKTGRLSRGHLFTGEVMKIMRREIAATLTREDLRILLADVLEHSPPNMPALRIQEPLPQDAPFVAFPPRLFKRLPPLPPELRYLVLEKALVLWDHHADLVVDIAPGLFDPATYPASQPQP